MQIKQKYQPGGKGAAFILIVLFLLFVLNFADRAILSISLQAIKESLQLSDMQAGSLQSMFLLGVGLLMIPGAILVERVSRRKTLGVMALVWSIATFAVGLGRQFWHLLTALFIMGIGEAGFNPGGTSWLSLAFSKKVRGRVLGFFQSATQLGTAVGLILGGWLISLTHDWRVPFYVFAVPGLILGICTFFLPDYTTVKAKGEGTFNRHYFAGILGLFKIKTYSCNVVAQTLYVMVAMTLLGWLPTLMIRTYSVEPSSAGIIMGLTALTVLLGAPLGGWLGDKWQAKKHGGRAYFMIVSVLIYAVAATFTVWATNWDLNTFIVWACLSAFCNGLVLPGVFSIWTDIVPVENRATGVGMGTMISMVIGAVPGPLFLGAMSDTLGGGAAGLRTAFMMMMPISFLALIMYIIVARFYPADSANISDEVLAEE
jgi:MFS family permease